MSSIRGHLVVLAPLVLVVTVVVIARSIPTPRSSTVHRLRATRGRALLVVVAVWASVSVVSGALGVLVVPAPVVLVVRTLVVARPVSSPGTHAIHRLGAPRGGALPVVIAVGAARAIVSGVLGDLVRPAALVLGALQGPPVFT